MNIHAARFTSCPSCCHFISRWRPCPSPLTLAHPTLSRSRKRLHHPPTVGRKIISGRLIARREQSGRFGDGTKQEFPLMKSGSLNRRSPRPPPMQCIFVCGLLLPPRGTDSHTSISSNGRGTFLRVKTHMQASSIPLILQTYSRICTLLNLLTSIALRVPFNGNEIPRCWEERPE